MPEWEREYARLRTQQAVGPAVNVMVQFYPYPEVMLICRACEEYLHMDLEARVWACECGAAEMRDSEIKGAMREAFTVLYEKVGPPPEKGEDDWLTKVRKAFR